MRSFLFSALLLTAAACSSYYKNIRSTATDHDCIEKIRPHGMASAWFNTGVDVIGNHISGLLLIKEMPDRSTRIVFTNEVGVTFFDFEFGNDGTFAVKKIIDQLNRKAVIKTLENDFSLLLGLPFKGPLQAWQHNGLQYFGITTAGQRIYFTTASGCGKLASLETGSARKRKVSIALEGADPHAPEKITIRHYTFDMVITLKKFDQDAEG